MKSDIIIKSLIEIIANTKPGEPIPPIKRLTEDLQCSRGIIQNSLHYLSTANAIVLDKSYKHTVVVEKDVSVLAKLYFGNELKFGYFNQDNDLIVSYLLTEITNYISEITTLSAYSIPITSRELGQQLIAEKQIHLLVLPSLETNDLVQIHNVDLNASQTSFATYSYEVLNQLYDIPLLESIELRDNTTGISFGVYCKDYIANLLI